MMRPHRWMEENLMYLINEYLGQVPMNSTFDDRVELLRDETLQEEQEMLMKFAGYLAKKGYINQLDYEELENLTFDFYHETFKSE